MSYSGLNRATHFSVVWALTLVIVTVLEWHSLDRDPLSREIMSPFIGREVTIVPAPASGALIPGPIALQQQVTFHFDGPLFLACFFGPVLVFHGIAYLLFRMRGK